MQRRPRLTLKQVAAAFDAARGVLSDQIRRKDAGETLERDHGFNPKNALITIDVCRHMISGRAFQMPISFEALGYCVERITREDGALGREKALKSYLGFIEYLESKRIHTRSHKELYQSLCAEKELEPDPVYPDEVDAGEGVGLTEGAVRSVQVNQYERNPEARRQAIAHYGCRCSVCGFDFESFFGNIGRGFIHVHHIVDLALVGEEYQVDPIEDLRPVCPNCHAMLHKEKPAMSIECLAFRIKAQTS
jgi:5-methylcytosine-specific restriction protein A